MSSVTIRSVVADTPESLVEARTLVRSLRQFGGSMAHAPVELLFLGELPEDTDWFADRSVVISSADPIDPRCPSADKIGALTPVETDYLLVLDSDIVVAADVSPHLVGESVAAVPAYTPAIAADGWDELWEAAGLTAPVDRMMTVHARVETYPYFDTSMLIIPQSSVEALSDGWRWYLTVVLDVANLHAWSDETLLAADCLALTLALVETQLPRRVLPYQLNWLMNYELPKHLNPGGTWPVLMNTDHQMDYGKETLNEPPHRYCQAVANQFNKAVRTERRLFRES